MTLPSCMTWMASLPIRFYPPNTLALCVTAPLPSLNQNCLVLTTHTGRVLCVMDWENANILPLKKSLAIAKNRSIKGRLQVGINVMPTILGCWPPLQSIMALIWKCRGKIWTKSTKTRFCTVLAKIKWPLILLMSADAVLPKPWHLKGCCPIWSAAIALPKAA